MLPLAGVRRASREPTANISGLSSQLKPAPCAVPDSLCPLVQPSAMRAPNISIAPPAALASGERGDGLSGARSGWSASRPPARRARGRHAAEHGAEYQPRHPVELGCLFLGLDVVVHMHCVGGSLRAASAAELS